MPLVKNISDGPRSVPSLRPEEWPAGEERELTDEQAAGLVIQEEVFAVVKPARAPKKGEGE